MVEDRHQLVTIRLAMKPTRDLSGKVIISFFCDSVMFPCDSFVRMDTSNYYHKTIIHLELYGAVINPM